MDDLTRAEYETFRRSPDWELSNVWRALHMMEWLNGPEERARIAAVRIIRAERRAARKSVAPDDCVASHCQPNGNDHSRCR